MRRLSLPTGKTFSRAGKGATPGRAGTRQGQPRRRAVPLWRSRVLWGGLLAVMAVGAASGTWWMWRTGWLTQMVETVRWEMVVRSADLGFRVQDIQVTGRNRADAGAILGAVRIAEGAPILAFDADAARRRIEALPWVGAAVVERRLPDTIFLRLEERLPAALWQHEGRFRLIDGDGTVILDEGLGADLAGYGHLPVVVGRDAAGELAGLLVLLETEPTLMGRVVSGVRVGARRWNLWLKPGRAAGGEQGLIEVRLPEINGIEAWRQLGQYQKETGVLDRAIQAIDLRLPDRVTVRPIVTGAPAIDQKPKHEI